MKKGYLSAYFDGIAVKRLSVVETTPQISHQHEFNGVSQLKEILGANRCIFSSKFVYLGESEEECVTAIGTVTWYDARENHPKRSEYRLYYQENSVSELASEGDLLVIGKLPDNSLLVIIARANTTFERNIVWLFNLSYGNMGSFAIKEVRDQDDFKLDFASKFILEELGIEAIETDENYLDNMIDKFGNVFPSTNVFSAYARETISVALEPSNPDDILLIWMEREEMLFKTFEHYIVAERLKQGFENDVDGFISYSLGVQNRRKSRVGHALENHVEQILNDNLISYTRGGKTENNAKPDFVFPSIKDYHNAGFPASQLAMLGVKSTCKDRWRQVLSEASRIQNKHLLTLQPGISENQTKEMQANKLQLILPKQLHNTYSENQQTWLMDLSSFLSFIKNQQ
ncbi:MAG: type II restriction endonuclease [Peptococcaceae bacterium]